MYVCMYVFNLVHEYLENLLGEMNSSYNGNALNLLFCFFSPL